MAKRVADMTPEEREAERIRQRQYMVAFRARNPDYRKAEAVKARERLLADPEKLEARRAQQREAATRKRRREGAMTQEDYAERRTWQKMMKAADDEARKMQEKRQRELEKARMVEARVQAQMEAEEAKRIASLTAPEAAQPGLEEKWDKEMSRWTTAWSWCPRCDIKMITDKVYVWCGQCGWEAKGLAS